MEATLASILAASTPLIFIVIGETITEKAGVINLSLDGTVLLSAMVGFAGAYESGSVIVGFAAAALVSALAALLVAYSSIALRLNQVAVGFVLFQLTGEMSAFLGDPYVRVPGPTVTYRPIPLLEDVPFVGKVFFQHDLVVYGSIVLIFVTYWFMFRTRRGLKLQAVGERPEAAHSRGVPVNRLRYLYAAGGGVLVGMGGAAYSLGAKIGWSEGHTTGLGWIALAIVIFGGWHPYRAAFGVYLFGALQFSAIKLQDVFPDLTQVLGTLPFPIMIFTLVLVYSDRVRSLTDRYPALRGILGSDPPSAIGTRFDVD